MSLPYPRTPIPSQSGGLEFLGYSVTWFSHRNGRTISWVGMSPNMVGWKVFAFRPRWSGRQTSLCIIGRWHPWCDTIGSTPHRLASAILFPFVLSSFFCSVPSRGAQSSPVVTMSNVCFIPFCYLKTLVSFLCFALTRSGKIINWAGMKANMAA